MKKPKVVKHFSKSSSSKGSKSPKVTNTRKKSSLFSKSVPAVNVSVKRKHHATPAFEDDQSSENLSDNMPATTKFVPLPWPANSQSSSDSQMQPILCVTPPSEHHITEPVTSTLSKIDFKVKKNKKSINKGRGETFSEWKFTKDKARGSKSGVFFKGKGGTQKFDSHQET